MDLQGTGRCIAPTGKRIHGASGCASKHASPEAEGGVQRSGERRLMFNVALVSTVHSTDCRGWAQGCGRKSVALAKLRPPGDGT
jgi:hypothetical protein